MNRTDFNTNTIEDANNSNVMITCLLVLQLDMNTVMAENIRTEMKRSSPQPLFWAAWTIPTYTNRIAFSNAINNLTYNLNHLKTANFRNLNNLLFALRYTCVSETMGWRMLVEMVIVINWTVIIRESINWY